MNLSDEAEYDENVPGSSKKAKPEPLRLSMEDNGNMSSQIKNDEFRKENEKRKIILEKKSKDDKGKKSK